MFDLTSLFSVAFGFLSFGIFFFFVFYIFKTVRKFTKNLGIDEPPPSNFQSLIDERNRNYEAIVEERDRELQNVSSITEVQKLLKEYDRKVKFMLYNQDQKFLRLPRR